VGERDKSLSVPDIFIANEIYPDAAGIFAAQYRGLQSVKDDCLVVLDTNTLLVPYTIGPKTLGVIHGTYSRLVKGKRLIIPGQVVREFAKHRSSKLAELHQQLNRKKQVAGLWKGSYPLLESIPDYNAATDLEKQIDDLMSKYRNAIEKVLDHVRKWTWDDPVSAMYAELFGDGVVLDPPLKKDAMKEDFERRKLHRIPPGFKDDGIGDLLIWHAILELGRKEKRDVVFVSHDEKTDWYHQSDGQALYPRHELVDEFRRASGGRSFHIMRFSAFLDLYGAGTEVVQEVQAGERTAAAAEVTRGARWGPLTQAGVVKAVADWLNSRALAEGCGGGGACVGNIDAGEIGVHKGPGWWSRAMVILARRLSLATIHEAINSKITMPPDEMSVSSFSLVIVAQTRSGAERARCIIEHHRKDIPRGYEVVVGWVVAKRFTKLWLDVM
jgi:rRNA-processing protein FCF1